MKAVVYTVVLPRELFIMLCKVALTFESFFKNMTLWSPLTTFCLNKGLTKWIEKIYSVNVCDYFVIQLWHWMFSVVQYRN